MSDFKVGDIVKRVEWAAYIPEMTEGSLWEVGHVNRDGGLRLVNTAEWCVYDPKRFVKVGEVTHPDTDWPDNDKIAKAHEMMKEYRQIKMNRPFNWDTLEHTNDLRVMIQEVFPDFQGSDWQE